MALTDVIEGSVGGRRGTWLALRTWATILDSIARSPERLWQQQLAAAKLLGKMRHN